MGIMEAFDIGALFSMLVGAFVFYHAIASGGPLRQKLATGIGRLCVVALSAALISAAALMTLISTQIKGVAGTQQDTRTKLERWDWATQWSLPKREALGLIVPGLFGYRMDTSDGGNYWGAVGRDPKWDRYFASDKQGPPPQGFMRFTGGGNYAGVLVVLVALWTTFQSFRRNRSVFPASDRRVLRFWAVAVLVCLLLAFGRFAPFYQILYQLPYFSTIRNPAKFLHLLSFALLILFAFGIDGLSRRYFQRANVAARDSFTAWWSKAEIFEKRWIVGCLMALVVSLLGWLFYSMSRGSLEEYLQTVHFDEQMAEAIAAFSIRQVGWFIVFLSASVALLVTIMKGVFSGPRARLGSVLLGLLLVLDLGRANLPWIVYWNYKEKYATNPVIDFLREKPYQHRVAILPFRLPPELSLLDQLYRIEWAQHHFLYYNIHSLDIVQMPRVPQDLAAFEEAIAGDLLRRWQLTSTRYLLGPAGFLEPLNQQLDPQGRFRVVMTFEIVPRPGVSRPTRLEELTASPSADGRYALFEFAGALPRAKLYSNWRVVTNDQAALDLLPSAEFKPQEEVIVSAPVPEPPLTAEPSTNTGSVAFVSYAPKRIELKADAHVPSILLLNDKHDPNWRVSVNGKPQPLLRCNYIMRGVHLPAGDHTVVFTFEPPTGALYISVAALIGGLLLLVIVVAGGSRGEKSGSETGA
jgi:hypothetical protein